MCINMGFRRIRVSTRMEWEFDDQRMPTIFGIQILPNREFSAIKGDLVFMEIIRKYFTNRS